MPVTRIWHPDQGAQAVFSTYPVVAFCLPPASFLNRSAVKHTIHNYILHITMLAIDITRALNLSVNRQKHCFVDTGEERLKMHILPVLVCIPAEVLTRMVWQGL